MIQIKNLKENDEYFNATFAKFCNSSLDSKALSDLIKYIQKKLDLSNLSLPAANQDNSYLTIGHKSSSIFLQIYIDELG
jgi:hypothetical protein